MEIRVFKHEEALADCAAKKLLADAVSDNPVLGLATGSSPVPTYEAMCRLSEGIRFDDLKTVSLDEYVGLKPNHPQSFAYFMQEKLLGVLRTRGLRPENMHIPNGVPDNMVAECRRYETVVDQITPNTWLLGIGHNGHVAFNEPGSSADSKTRVIEMAPETQAANARFFGPGETMPTQAITVGISTIMKASKLLMIVTGAGKAEALQQLKHRQTSTDFPATLIRNHPNFTVLADEAAARTI